MCNQSQGYYGSNNTLSPAAQAVLDALCLEELNGPQQILARAHAAAALYAAADQVMPDESHPELSQFWDDEAEREWQNNKQIRSALLAIAAELEAQ